MQTIVSTFAYHAPDNTTPDLELPTELVSRYAMHKNAVSHRPSIDPQLKWDIQQNGIIYPLTIACNGTSAILRDGNHRLRIAEALGIEALQVQVHPDNFKRLHHPGGFPSLEPVLKAWVESHLLQHKDHEMVRRFVGGGTGSGGIPANKFIRVNCNCGAQWKEMC